MPGHCGAVSSTAHFRERHDQKDMNDPVADPVDRKCDRSITLSTEADMQARVVHYRWG